MAASDEALNRTCKCSAKALDPENVKGLSTELEKPERSSAGLAGRRAPTSKQPTQTPAGQSYRLVPAHRSCFPCLLNRYTRCNRSLRDSVKGLVDSFYYSRMTGRAISASLVTSPRGLTLLMHGIGFEPAPGRNYVHVCQVRDVVS